MSHEQKINLDKCPDFICPVCSCTLFRKVYRSKFVSAFLVGAPRNQIVMIEEHQCRKCLHVVNDDDIQKFKIPTADGRAVLGDVIREVNADIKAFDDQIERYKKIDNQ